MSYTLISSVGTGMYKEGYRKTVYVFEDGKKIENHIFLNALLQNNYREIKKIILIGTVTSAWDMLVDISDDLWIKTCEAKENRAIDQALITEIEQYLTQKLQKEVIIKFHTDIIDNNTSLEIFDIYNSIIPEIKDENILFDITHGFRSMPILIYQALQFSISQNSNIKKVELVYGEYIESKKESYVRDLSDYWRYSQISDAMTLFIEKLQGNRLSELLQTEWPDCAKVIKRFSDIIASNFSLQIIEVLRNIKNVLKKVPEDLPSYWNKIIDFLNELIKINENKTDARTLFDFAVFLYNKKLYVQSIITMQETVEMAVGEYNNCKEYVGDYDWWQESGKKLLNEEKKKDSKMKEKLNNLEYFRNQIAHGGGKSKRMKGFPQISNIEAIYNSGKAGVEKLLEMFNL